MSVRRDFFTKQTQIINNYNTLKFKLFDNINQSINKSYNTR